MAKPVPLYTRSLDAALKLVPDGWTIHRLGQLSDCQGGFGGWIGEIYRASDAMIPYPSSSAGGVRGAGHLRRCDARASRRDDRWRSTQTVAALDGRVQRSGT